MTIFHYDPAISLLGESTNVFYTNYSNFSFRHHGQKCNTLVGFRIESLLLRQVKLVLVSHFYFLKFLSCVDRLCSDWLFLLLVLFFFLLETLYPVENFRFFKKETSKIVGFATERLLFKGVWAKIAFGDNNHPKEGPEN